MIGSALVIAFTLTAQVDRLDLGVRLQSFENAYLRAHDAQKLSASDITEIDRRFDQLSVQFFAGNGGAAITELDRLTRRLVLASSRLDGSSFGSPEPDRADSAPLPSPVMVEGPLVLWPTQNIPLRYRIRGALEFEGQESISTSLGISLTARIPRDRAPSTSSIVTIDSSGANGEAKLTIEPFSDFDAWIDVAWTKAPTFTDVGEWVLSTHSLLRAGTEAKSDEIPVSIDLARIHLVQDDPDTASSAFLERLTNLSARADLAPDLLRAIAICRDRCSKLKSKWSGSDTLPVADDLERLRKHLSEEVAALEKSTNPYRLKAGNHWKTLRIGDSKALPYRVAAPFGVGELGKLPLVIAFHGMGGDENMFFSAYGAGRLRGLVESKQFLCVTPLTYDYLAKPDRIEALIEEIERDYAVDRERIHVLGHSMGAGVALSIAQKRGDLIASAAAFAGAGNRNSPICPTILFAGTNDGIVPFAGVERFATAPTVKDAITFHPLDGRGHTLLVGDHIEEAIDFLLAHPKKKP